VPFAPIELGPGRERILADELRLAEAADDLRRRHAFETAAVKVLLVLVPLFFAAMVLLARRRDRVPGVPRHLQEPPEDIHPVELAKMWAVANGRLGSANVYRTQMLHLANIGAIEMQAVGPVSDPDDWLHFVLGVAMIGLGFATTREGPGPGAV